MNLSDFKVHDWLMIGGGAAMLALGYFLDWTTIDTGFGSASGDGPIDYLFTGGIAWVLVVAVGILAVLSVAGRLPEEPPWAVIFLGLSGFATLLMLIRIIMGARFDFADRGIGMWGALIWSVISLAGAVMNFQAAGGTFSDLTDIDKLKGLTGSDTPPPPPPPPAN